MNGCEYNCYLDLDKRYHFHLLTLDDGHSDIKDDDISYKSLFYTELSQVQALIDLLKSRGNMVFIAHPKNLLIPLDLLERLKNYDGIEVYNTKANSDASDYYEALLKNRKIKCLAVDDVHKDEVDGRFMLFGGYIVVEDGMTPLEAIKSGAYYSSTGVQINKIQLDNKCVRVDSSSETEIHLYHPKGVQVIKGKEVNLSDDIEAFRVICYKEDKKAWSNLILI